MTEQRGAAQPTPPAATTDTVWRWAFIIGVGIVASNLAQPEVLDLPLRNVLKTDLNLSASEMAAFYALAGLPWYFKAVAGLLSDSVPLFRTRRRYYLICSAVFAGALWLVVGIVPRTFFPLLLTLFFINTMLVMVSTVVGGLLVEAGQRLGAAGRLVSARVFVESACALLAGPLAGFLAGYPLGVAAGASGLIAVTIVPVALALLHEPPTATRDVSVFADAHADLRMLVRSRLIWAVALLIFLDAIPQELGTAIYYFQKNDLQFSDQVIGYLKGVAGGGSLVAPLIYGFFRRRLALRPLLVLGLASGALGPLTYIFYRSLPSALAVEFVHGFLFTLNTLVLMEVAVLATPRRVAAMGFAILMSAFNAGDAIGDILAANLVERGVVSVFGTAWLYTALAALMLLAVPLLPRAIFVESEGPGGSAAAASP